MRHGFAALIYNYTVPTGGYAPNGNLLGVSDSVTGNWNYTYDNLNRLLSAQGGSNLQGLAPYGTGLLQFSYDSFGNFQGQTLTGNSSATVTQVAYTFQGQSLQNGVPLSGAYNNRVNGYNYDAAGNQLNEPGFGLTSYVYDAEGRVTTASGATQYLYDAEGHRVGKLNNGVLTNIYLLGLGGEQVTELNTSTGSMAWAHSNVYASGRLFATYDNQGTHFEFSDWLGTKRVQANANGTIEETCLSLPFGDSLNCSGPGADATEQHFTGKERDAESGLDYFPARYLGSSMGRWLSPDIVGGDFSNPQSLNRYAYVLNNPLALIDSLGFDAQQACVTATDKSGSSTTCQSTTQSASVAPYASGQAFGGADCGTCDNFGPVSIDENSTPSLAGGAAQTALDLAGMIPGPVGMVANIASAGMSASDGNWGAAALSLAFAVPIIGQIGAETQGALELGEGGYRTFEAFKAAHGAAEEGHAMAPYSWADA